MIVRRAVVKAAENRKPAEIVEKPRLDREFAAEALLAPTPGAPADGSGLMKRTANLAFAGAKPSTTELERLIGNNDLVDEFYLQRALVAAMPVMRITLRDAAGRERGWATGFMVSPHLLLTNWHVFPNLDETTDAIAEAHYVLDIAGNPAPSYRFNVRGDLFYSANQALDFALVAVDEVALDGQTPLSQFGYHRLIAEPNKIREGEAMTLIQHPGGERRQFAIRENQLVKILDNFLWYQSDTAPGSSGAPAFNDSYQVVALHHSGAPKRDAAGNYVLRDGTTVASLDGIDDSRVDWIANEGLRISVLCTFLKANMPLANPFTDELNQAIKGGDVMTNALSGKLTTAVPADQESAAAPSTESASANVLTIPLQLQISVSLSGAAVAHMIVQGGSTALSADVQTTPAAAVETLKYPVVDRDYSTRTGYDAQYLGVSAPLPTLTDTALVAQLSGGSPELLYEHFTVVINKKRRLPLFTASNVDYAPAKRRPEPGDYSRKGLTGLGPNDQEKWYTDPRIPEQDQLPNIFYDKDGGSFDKGHVARREDVCWGSTRNQVVRANGDTFHVTNCTPQVAGFNRSTLGDDNWGDLEDEIQSQGKAEKLSVIAGPFLADDDKFFDGKDDLGPVKIQIPREFWKVVLANENGQLAAYAFVLQQDLHNVPEEFLVTATWAPFLVSIAKLEARLAGFTFAPEIHAADRSATNGQELATAIGAGIHPSLTNPAP